MRIQNDVTLQLIDLDLSEGEGFILNSKNDVAIVTGKISILSDFVRCLLVHKGSWAHDTNFGSTIHLLLKNSGPLTVEEDDVREEVYNACASMLSQGKIEAITSVKIIDRQRSGITVEIVLVISDENAQIRLNLPIV